MQKTFNNEEEQDFFSFVSNGLSEVADAVSSAAETAAEFVFNERQWVIVYDDGTSEVRPLPALDKYLENPNNKTDCFETENYFALQLAQFDVNQAILMQDIDYNKLIESLNPLIENLFEQLETLEIKRGGNNQNQRIFFDLKLIRLLFDPLKKEKI